VRVDVAPAAAPARPGRAEGAKVWATRPFHVKRLASASLAYFSCRSARRAPQWTLGPSRVAPPAATPPRDHGPRPEHGAQRPRASATVYVKRSAAPEPRPPVPLGSSCVAVDRWVRVRERRADRCCTSRRGRSRGGAAPRHVRPFRVNAWRAPSPAGLARSPRRCVRWALGSMRGDVVPTAGPCRQFAPRGAMARIAGTLKTVSRETVRLLRGVSKSCRSCRRMPPSAIAPVDVDVAPIAAPRRGPGASASRWRKRRVRRPFHVKRSARGCSGIAARRRCAAVDPRPPSMTRCRS
jgi:hypothetical protein